MILLTLARSHLLQYNNWYSLTCLLFSFNFGNGCLKEEEEEEESDLESTTLSVYWRVTYFSKKTCQVIGCCQYCVKGNIFCCRLRYVTLGFGGIRYFYLGRLMEGVRSKVFTYDFLLWSKKFDWPLWNPRHFSFSCYLRTASVFKGYSEDFSSSTSNYVGSTHLWEKKSNCPLSINTSYVIWFTIHCDPFYCSPSNVTQVGLNQVDEFVACWVLWSHVHVVIHRRFVACRVAWIKSSNTSSSFVKLFSPLNIGNLRSKINFITLKWPKKTHFKANRALFFPVIFFLPDFSFSFINYMCRGTNEGNKALTKKMKEIKLPPTLSLSCDVLSVNAFLLLLFFFIGAMDKR